MRENRTSGSVRGAPGNRCSYREMPRKGHELRHFRLLKFGSKKINHISYNTYLNLTIAEHIFSLFMVS